MQCKLGKLSMLRINPIFISDMHEPSSLTHFFFWPSCSVRQVCQNALDVTAVNCLRSEKEADEITLTTQKNNFIKFRTCLS